MDYNNAAEVIAFGKKCKRWFAIFREPNPAALISELDLLRLEAIRHKFVFTGEFEEADRIFCAKIVETVDRLKEAVQPTPAVPEKKVFRLPIPEKQKPFEFSLPVSMAL